MSQFSLKIYSCILLLTTLGGCASKPLPKDFARLDTYQISQKIRCEMRDAIRARIVNFLDRAGSFDPVAAELAINLRQNPGEFRDFDSETRGRLAPGVKKLLDRYDSGAVGYDFTFTVTEQNVTDGNIGLGQNLTRGLLTLTASSSADKKRKTIRNFVVVDNFERLARDYGYDLNNQDFCETFEKGRRIKYPIVGDLGLDEFTQTFFSLNEFSNPRQLVPGKDSNLLADTLEFTTTLKAGAKGEVKLSAVGDALKITSGLLQSNQTRIDNHKLILSMSLPDDSKIGKPTFAEKSARERATAELRRQRRLEVERNTVIIGESLLGGPLIP